MYLNLGICIVLKDYRIIRMEDVDFRASIDIVKSKVADRINMLKETIELSYSGETLNENTTLLDNGIKEGFVVMVFQKKKREYPLPPAAVLDSEINDLVRVFQILATRNAHRRVLQKINKPDVLENIISTTPGLNEDSTAIVILQHPELIARLGDKNAVKRVVEKHPALANAARNLVAAVQNDMRMFPSTSISRNMGTTVPFAVGSDDEEMELMGNGDSESRNSGNNDGEQPVNLITTSQVAAALANTAAVRSSSQSTTSSSAAAGITSGMMSAALQQAIASTSTASTSTASANPSETREAQDDVFMLAKVEELRKLGFTNDANNILALQIAKGDLETAVNLILSGLMDDSC